MNTAKHYDPVCGMQIEETDAAGHSDFEQQVIYFCSSGCQEKFDANPEQFRTPATNVMNELNNTPVVIAFVLVIVLFLMFGGGAMSGSMMNGGMMGQGSTGGFGWMWIPTFLTFGVGIVLGWMIFGQKR